MKVSVLRYAAIGMATLSLAGFAAASSVTMDTTGPHSTNRVNLNNTFRSTSTNRNAVGVGNLSFQGSQTGNVKASDNTTVGDTGSDLSSGNANNNNSATTNVTVTNSSALGAGGLDSMSAPDDTIHFGTTGPHSTNQVTVNNSATLTQTNTNEVQVLNLSLQSAKSGNVNANDNTTVGGLSSGNASNTNTSSTTVGIHN